VTDATVPEHSTIAISHEQGELHRLLVEAVQDYAIFALDARGYILTWNAGAAAFKGYTSEEAVGQHFSIFYPTELIAEGFPDFELRTAERVGRFENDGWRVRKDGTQFWANVVITALHDKAGALLGFAKITRDLTDRRRAEEALRSSEQSLRLLVEGVKDYAIFMLDLEGRILTWNSGAERINGYTREEIVGSSFSKFYLPEDIASGKPEHELEIATRTGTYEEEGWRIRKDGVKIWASVLITALYDHTGTLVSFAKVTRDLTERRAAEKRAREDAERMVAQTVARDAAEVREREVRVLADKLDARKRDAEQAQERADSANRVKGEFLAAMSHELRTPLNAIGGYADLLSMGLSGAVTPLQVEQLGRIKQSQQHLLGIINDILNFSRAEAGQLAYDWGLVPLSTVVDSVLEMVVPQLREKSLRIARVLGDDDAVAWADRARVGQILLNLVSNAMKFTGDSGQISVSCCRIDDDWVGLSVRDTGCGIAASHLDAIFQPFVQVGRTLTGAHQGTGLGLSISRDLARAMYGDLCVKSVEHAGSVFTLTLPTRETGRMIDQSS
jgi:PAS domain S-box-containing protein